MVNFETMYLTIPKEEAARHISERVSNLRRRQTGKGFEYRTNAGFHLATLSDATLGTGAPGSKLRYRTSYIRPHLFHTHNKAGDIRKAVEQFQTSHADT